MKYDVDTRTREEWRELGFYYEHRGSAWHILGSRAGISNLAEIVLRFAHDDRNWNPPDHEHLGPYHYLTITADTSSSIDERGISGNAQELDHFAMSVKTAIDVYGPGEAVSLREYYDVSSPFDFILEIQPDDFDPASADPLLKGPTVIEGSQ